MPDRNSSFFLVSYDISSDKKRAKTASVLENFGMRVQRSLFECRLSSSNRLLLFSNLDHLICPESDSIRIYPLCRACAAHSKILGHANFYDDADPVFFL